jgi:hypothetical protein
MKIRLLRVSSPMTVFTRMSGNFILSLVTKLSECSYVLTEAGVGI